MLRLLVLTGTLVAGRQEVLAPDVADEPAAVTEPSPDEDEVTEDESAENRDIQPAVADMNGPELNPMAWVALGILVGTGVGLLVALPVVGGFAAIVAIQAAPTLANPAAETPWGLFELGLMALAVPIYLGGWAYGLAGIIPSALAATIATVLGAPYVSRRKLPWVPACLALSVPKGAGCVVGVLSWFVSLMSFFIAVTVARVAMVLNDPSGRTPLVPSGGLPAWYVLTATCFLFMCPTCVFGGAAMGDAAGFGLMWQVNRLLGRRMRSGESRAPTDLFSSAWNADEDDKDDTDSAQPDE